MNAQKPRWRMHLRVVWSITAKDLLEAVKNRNTISVLLSGLFIVGMYRMLPDITRGSDPPRVWIYDQGHSSRVITLEESQIINARTGIESLDRVLYRVRQGDRPELGLEIPPGFDQRLEDGEQLVLQGYVMNWVSEQDAADLTRTVEDEIEARLGGQVSIQTEGNTLYLQPGSTGPGVQTALGTVFMLTMIGMSLVTHLIMAEKQEHTLEILLVSPASEVHVVAAKALTGMVYSLLTAGIALALNQAIVLHWWLAILAVVCFALFAIGLGLALGSKIETRAQLSLWSWVILIPLFIPAMVVLLEGLVPEPVILVLRFVPTVAFTTALRYSFAEPISLIEPLAWLAYTLLWAGVVLALVIWMMRRRDRRAEAGAASKARMASSSEAAASDLLAWAEAGSDMGGASGAEAIEPLSHERALSSRGREFPAERPSRVRILWAIFVKDMREALANRLLLSILVGTLFVILNGTALPLLLENSSRTSAVIWDQGHSSLLRDLIRNDEIRIVTVESREQLEENISSGPGTWLGLILPADFDDRAGDVEPIELEGYAAHWGDSDRIQLSVERFEQLLSRAAAGEVRINTAGNVVYPTADVGGQISINLTTVMIAVTAIGAALVPLLLVEEKENHTLETMLVSPASYGEVLLGKALVGGTYGLLATAAAFLLSAQYIVHWELALLAALLSVSFVVSVGMLIGILSENPTSAAMWTAPAILIVLVPTMAQFFIRADLPMLVANVLDWMPGTLMVNLFRISAAGEVPAGQLAANALALAAMAGVLYLLVNWRLRAIDR